MKYIRTFENFETNEGIFTRKTDDEKFQKAISKLTTGQRRAFDTFDDAKKAQFKEFIRKNGWETPQYYTYKDGEFTSASSGKLWKGI